MADSALHVILIDDDEVDTEAVARLLRGHTPLYALSTFMDGAAAREALEGDLGRQLGAKPYVILLDINMPRLNGFEFLEWLRSEPRLSGAVVFMFTTSQWENDVRRAYEYHVAGYLIKSRLGSGYEKLAELLDAYAGLTEFPPLGTPANRR